MGKRNVLAWIAMGAVAATLAACGSDDDSAATTPATSPVTTPAATTPGGTTPDGTTPGATTPATEPAPTTVPDFGKITFSGVTPNAGNWALQIGVEKGIFKDFGVDAELIYSQSSAASLAALFGGSVQFTTAIYDAAIPAFQQNPDIVYVASGYDFLPYELIVDPKITSVEDLEGKTCMAQNPPTIGDGLYVQLMLSEASGEELSYPDDYQIATLPVTAASALGALQSGQVQCVGLLPPVSGLLNNEGFPTLIKAADLDGFQGLPFFGLNTLRSWAEDHEEETVAFLKGYLASIAWLEDPANKDEAISILAKNAGLEITDAEAAYAWVTAGGFPREGLIKDDAIANDLGLAQKFDRLTDVKPEDLADLVDLQYVQRAYDELPQEIKDTPSVVEG